MRLLGRARGGVGFHENELKVEGFAVYGFINIKCKFRVPKFRVLGMNSLSHVGCLFGFMKVEGYFGFALILFHENKLQVEGTWVGSLFCLMKKNSS